MQLLFHEVLATVIVSDNVSIVPSVPVNCVLTYVLLPVVVIATLIITESIHSELQCQENC
jgi:hypothetical protein